MDIYAAACFVLFYGYSFVRWARRSARGRRHERECLARVAVLLGPEFEPSRIH